MYNFKNIPLDDKLTWDLICSGRTIGIFQLESQLGQAWAKKIKPRSIDELSDLIALIRPSCLEAQMTDNYAKIKNGEMEPEYISDALIPILEKTKSCLIYQEQSMKIGMEIAGFTDVESDKYIRKGIGKKLPEVIAECKKIFLSKAKEKNLVSVETAEEIFSWLEKAQRYQFNKCLTGDTLIETIDGFKFLEDIKIGDLIKAPDIKNNRDTFIKIKDKMINGVQDIVEITLESGKTIKCTLGHKFLFTDNIIRPISSFLQNKSTSLTIPSSLYTCGMKKDIILYAQMRDPEITYNIEVDSEDHLYYANGIVTQNSHSVSYAITGYLTAFQKANYPTEFYTSWLTHSNNKPNPKEEIYNLVQDARINDILVCPPDIREKNTNFTILENSKILFGLSHIRGVGDSALSKIYGTNSSLNTFKDFIISSKILKRNICESLIKAGACDCYNQSRTLMLRCIHALYGQTDKSTENSSPLIKSLTPKETSSFFESFKTNDFITSLELIISDNKCVKKRVSTIEAKIKNVTEENVVDTNRQKSIWERLYLGLPLTCSEVDDFLSIDNRAVTCKEILLSTDKEATYCTHVVIESVKIRESGKNSKNPGTKYASLSVSDNSSAIQNILVWSHLFERIKDFLNEGSVITIYIKKSEWKNTTQYVCNDVKIV